MNELTTARLRLQPFRDHHLDGLYAMNSDPEVMKYLGRAQTREETANLIPRVQGHWQRYGYSWWAFVDQVTAEVVGAGCIQNLRRSGVDPDPQCPMEIGWRLRRGWWHRGLAFEAALAMGGFAFEQLSAERLYAVCHPENGASESIMRRLGMSLKGVEQWYSSDLTTYVITAPEWRRLHPSETK